MVSFPYHSHIFRDSFFVPKTDPVFFAFFHPFEVEDIIFTMEETEEDPFFFKHDSLLPYRREAFCVFLFGV